MAQVSGRGAAALETGTDSYIYRSSPGEVATLT